MLFSCRMKQKWTRKTNNTIFGLFIWPKIKMFHVCLKYVIITDISGFEALPKVQNWVKIYWNLVILLNCVRKQVYFKKIFKIRTLDKVRFSQMSTLQPTVRGSNKWFHFKVPKNPVEMRQKSGFPTNILTVFQFCYSVQHL